MPNWIGHWLPRALRKPLSPKRLQADVESGRIHKIREDNNEHVLARMRHNLPQMPAYYSGGTLLGRGVIYFWDRDGKPMRGKLDPIDWKDIRSVSETHLAPGTYRLRYGLPADPTYIREHTDSSWRGNLRWHADFWDVDGKHLGTKPKQII